MLAFKGEGPSIFRNQVEAYRELRTAVRALPEHFEVAMPDRLWAVYEIPEAARFIGEAKVERDPSVVQFVYAPGADHPGAEKAPEDRAQHAPDDEDEDQAGNDEVDEARGLRRALGARRG